MYERILVPVDGSATSNRGLDEAVRLAKLAGSRIRLLHVVDELYAAMGMPGFGEASVNVLQMLKEGGQKVLVDASARVKAQGVGVDTVLVDTLSGRLHEQVLQQARDWGAGLIVLGSHGRRGVERMVLGSDAEQIIRNSEVPVLVVRVPRAPDAPR